MHAIWAWGAPEYRLSRRQWVPRALDETFRFFEDPRNLPRITPKWLGFDLLSIEPADIRVGTRIVYRLRWLGIPYRWQTLIAAWEPGVCFVDTQMAGPYILWHHTHTFEPGEGGVTILDCVRYRLPFGPVGVLLHRLLIRRQLDAIFDFRARTIAEILADGRVYEGASVYHGARPALPCDPRTVPPG